MGSQGLLRFSYLPAIVTLCLPLACKLEMQGLDLLLCQPQPPCVHV